jgi:hypothetical protein
METTVTFLEQVLSLDVFTDFQIVDTSFVKEFFPNVSANTAFLPLPKQDIHPKDYELQCSPKGFKDLRKQSGSNQKACLMCHLRVLNSLCLKF